MKKAIAITALLVGSIVPANADVYVKVDASGNVISGPIMCDAETCAEGSGYSQNTLNQGERYVLQNKGQAGVGSSANTAVKVDVPNDIWTVTTPQTVTTFGAGVIDNVVPIVPVITETSTATAISDTATVLSDTPTATIKNVTVSDAIAEIMALLTKIFQLLAILNR